MARYVRHGATATFAAPLVATGKVTYARPRRRGGPGEPFVASRAENARITLSRACTHGAVVAGNVARTDVLEPQLTARSAL